ncbi:MAG: hypothetical protein K9J76_10755 [Polaromonas sp.]|nr:hypothetical protein [Polaromonas sp.]
MNIPISGQPLSLAQTLATAQDAIDGQIAELNGRPLDRVQSAILPIEHPGDLPPTVNAVPTPFTAQLSGRMQQVLGEMAGAASASLADSALGETARNLHDRVPRLMSSATLTENVGHKPKADLLFGLIGMSTHYKAVLGGLDAYQAKLSTPVGMDPASAREHAAGLAKDLTAIHRDADQYIKQHEGTPAKAKAVEAMRVMQSQVMNEMALVNRVATSLVDNAAVRGMSWKDSMAGAGYRLLDSVARYNDTNLAEANDSFGGGQVNEVAKLTYHTPEGGLETRIFKADPQRLDTQTSSPVHNRNTQNIINQVLVPSGIDPERPAFAARNVAMAFVNEALGLNNLVHTSFALHNETIGMVMDEAPGRTSYHHVKQAVPGLVFDFVKDAVQMMDAQYPQHTRQARIAEVLNDMAEEYKVVWNNASTRPEMASDTELQNPANWAQRITTSGYPDLLNGDVGGLKQANLQRGLSNLEWLDGLSAQTDRHGFNFMTGAKADGSITVTGIDNDFSFGSKIDGLPPGIGNCISGLPQLIDSRLAARLDALDFDRDLKPTLDTLLTPEEVSATRARFDQLKAHAASLAPDRVIDNWQTAQIGGLSVHDHLLAAGDDSSSYYKRDQAYVA